MLPIQFSTLHICLPELSMGQILNVIYRLKVPQVGPTARNEYRKIRQKVARLPVANCEARNCCDGALHALTSLFHSLTLYQF